MFQCLLNEATHRGYAFQKTNQEFQVDIETVWKYLQKTFWVTTFCAIQKRLQNLLCINAPPINSEFIIFFWPSQYLTMYMSAVHWLLLSEPLGKYDGRPFSRTLLSPATSLGHHVYKNLPNIYGKCNKLINRRWVPHTKASNSKNCIEALGKI